MQPLAVKRAGRRSGGSGGSSSGGGFGKRGKNDGAEASKDPEKRLANLNRKLTSILEVRTWMGVEDEDSWIERWRVEEAADSSRAFF